MSDESTVARFAAMSLQLLYVLDQHAPPEEMTKPYLNKQRRGMGETKGKIQVSISMKSRHDGSHWPRKNNANHRTSFRGQSEHSSFPGTNAHTRLPDVIGLQALRTLDTQGPLATAGQETYHTHTPSLHCGGCACDHLPNTSHQTRLRHCQSTQCRLLALA